MVLFQDVHIDLENPHKTQNFHFAVSGHSFGVLTTHFPEYIPRVMWGFDSKSVLMFRYNDCVNVSCTMYNNFAHIICICIHVFLPSLITGCC